MASAAAAASWGARPLPFLAVGRVKDGVTLASYTTAENDKHREQTKDVFTKLLQAGSQKLEKGQRTRLQWNEGSVCCLMDQKKILLYCVVTAELTYPERAAYQLLYDLVTSVQQIDGIESKPENALNEELHPKMRELIDFYEDQKNIPTQPQREALQVERETSVSTTNPAANAIRVREERKYKMIGGIAVAGCLIVAVIVKSLLF
jgi:hypothetical protein